MKFGLLGYGKMGRAIERLAIEGGHEVVSLQEADVCLEFTRPDAVLQNVRLLVELGKPMVIGTTGWEAQCSSVRELVEAGGVGCVYAANFSLGMQLFYQLIAAAGRLLREFSSYDVSGHEIHHRQKIDKPSGSAKKLAEILTEKLGLPLHEPLQFSSERCGEVPGTHLVRFDGSADTITLTHAVRSRQTFAEGALWAAEWVVDKKGFYAFEEVLGKKINFSSLIE